MEPFYFGRSQRPLFGQRHAPTGAARQTAVLICPSWGPEYMRCYRGLRTLATRLAATGFETLRFDYSGTGDSEGMALDSRLEHWLEDLATAAAELRALSGCQRLAVLGLRFGALLSEAAIRQGLKADAQILWDCPASGRDYVELMRALDQARDRIKAQRRSRDAQLIQRADNELCGHAWPPALAEAVSALPAPLARPGQLWVHSSDHTATGPEGAELLGLAEASHWQDEHWIGSPWLAVKASQLLTEKLGTWLR